jgi:hypothetical protein
VANRAGKKADLFTEPDHVDERSDLTCLRRSDLDST